MQFRPSGIQADLLRKEDAERERGSLISKFLLIRKESIECWNGLKSMNNKVPAANNV